MCKMQTLEFQDFTLGFMLIKGKKYKVTLGF